MCIVSHLLYVAM